jgi:hypothetical protein
MGAYIPDQPRSSVRVIRNELSTIPTCRLAATVSPVLLHTSTTPRKTALSSISIISILSNRLCRTEVLDNRPASLSIGENSIGGLPNHVTRVTHSIDSSPLHHPVSQVRATRLVRRVTFALAKAT